MEDDSAIIYPSGFSVGVCLEQLPQWPQWLEKLGWVYIIDGPDDLWGHLHASPDRSEVIDAMKQWCRENHRLWVETRLIAGEAVDVYEPYPANGATLF